MTGLAAMLMECMHLTIDMHFIVVQHSATTTCKKLQVHVATTVLSTCSLPKQSVLKILQHMQKWVAFSPCDAGKR